MPLPPDFPDYSDEGIALEVIREYVTKGGDDALTRRLYETQCADGVGKWYYRPYFAAMRALKANPRWLESGEGAKFRDLDHALAALAEDQASQDATLGLIVPPNLALPSLGRQTRAFSGSVPTVVIF